MKKRVQYFKCVTCNKAMPIKYGEMINEGFKCNKHNKPFFIRVLSYICKKCGRKIIKDLINRDIINGGMICVSCSGDKTLRFRQHGTGKNYGEHMSRKRHRLMKKHRHY